MALEAIDYAGFAARRRRARRQGRYLGIGIGNGVKGTGRGPFESGIVRIGRSAGSRSIRARCRWGRVSRPRWRKSVPSNSCVATDNVTVVAGDTAVIPYGQGGFASRQTITAGSSVHLAATRCARRVLGVAAHLLEAGVEDLELRNGRVEVRRRARAAAFHCAKSRKRCPACPAMRCRENSSPGLESMQSFLPDALTYGMGCHAVEVEVDVETGRVRILRYVVVNDSGKLINPMIVEGQLVGGAAHGIGNALYEWMGYDDGAQPLTTYISPIICCQAPEVPNIEVHFLQSPSPLNPLGVKGVGESGCVPAAGAIVAAVEDAVSPFGITIGEYPLIPAKLFGLIEAAGKRNAA